MQLFSKNQRQWSVPPLDPEVANSFRKAVNEEGIRSVAVHASYLINLGTGESVLQGKSRSALLAELERAGLLGIPYVILHPGAHMGAGLEKGLDNISEGARLALEGTEDSGVSLLFENSAGAGTTLGSAFRALSEMALRVDMPDRLGFCLDTCHLFASGLDFRTERAYRTLTEQIDGSLGLKKVRFFHLNDAKFPMGTHKDRHANIGEGEIGTAGFRNLMNDKRFRDVPGVLETPVSGEPNHPYASYMRDLKTLRQLSQVQG
jgi:deoxyribonuclease-4